MFETQQNDNFARSHSGITRNGRVTYDIILLVVCSYLGFVLRLFMLSIVLELLLRFADTYASLPGISKKQTFDQMLIKLLLKHYSLAVLHNIHETKSLGTLFYKL